MAFRSLDSQNTALAVYYYYKRNICSCQSRMYSTYIITYIFFRFYVGVVRPRTAVGHKTPSSGNRSQVITATVRPIPVVHGGSKLLILHAEYDMFRK